ncbi:Putative periplasmic or exported protein [Salmonella enterica subsp. arizonae]|nr:Putative periplasmic or exported protein [Salmonella enterica subsp. arizonae]
MSKASWLLLLGLCASGSALAASSESAFLAQHGLAGKTVEQIVDTIDPNAAEPSFALLRVDYQYRTQII